MNWLKSEAVMVQGVVQAAFGLGIAFGLHMSQLQLAAVLALSSSVLSLITRRVINNQ